MTVAVSASAAAMPPDAFAENLNFTHTMEQHEELSRFKADLESTGVIDELGSKASYTVFVPTNDAIHRVTNDERACVQLTPCRKEMADILRSHIVLGEMHLDDLLRQNGTVYSMNHRLIDVRQEEDGTFTVDGNHIISEPQAGRDQVYEIDGVMANAQEQADMRAFGKAQAQLSVVAQLLK